MQDCKLGIKSSRIPYRNSMPHYSKIKWWKISVVYICVFSLQLRKIKRIHGCIVSSTHKKRFGCFQDKNEEENNNAILKSWMKGGFFGELSIRSTLSKRKRATGIGLSAEVQETQIWVRKCLYRFNNNNTWLQIHWDIIREQSTS